MVRSTCYLAVREERVKAKRRTMLGLICCGMVSEAELLRWLTFVVIA